MINVKDLVPVKTRKKGVMGQYIMKALPKKETTKAASILFKMYIEKKKTSENSEFIQDRFEELQTPDTLTFN